MDSHGNVRTTPVSAGLDHSEEMIAEVDEPPDGYFWAKHGDSRGVSKSIYTKEKTTPWTRRESLLTRGLHSEVEHTEDESVTSPARALSTWSMTSTAELTSDDGRSMPSPAFSPHMLPSDAQHTLPVVEKPFAIEPSIVGLDTIAGQEKPEEATAKPTLEAELGRKRCISFACGNKAKPSQVAPPVQVAVEKPASPPKRKCMIKFACPTRAGAEQKPAEPVQTKRASSPAPPSKRPINGATPSMEKVHRGSDSTVTHVSPKNMRKAESSPMSTVQAAPVLARKLSNESLDSGAEATRFHEFATSEEEPEDWVQQSTCHRSRLTISDTLKKENEIRRLAEEAEEEALEEEDAELDDDEDEDDDDDDDDDIEVDDAEDDEDEDLDDETDDGFHSDDEHGFAGSDASDDESSDNEWWAPRGGSTAATSTDQLDHLARIKADRVVPGSSSSSDESDSVSPRLHKRKQLKLGRRIRTQAVHIDRLPVPDLPDSTDFVCGTLDEDRPMEQAYINCMKQREAAKHKPAPQDIDPTFPTSDPDMDEEDDEDLEDPEQSDSEELVHGDFDENLSTARPRYSPPQHPKSHHSPPHRTRGKSPAPPQRTRGKSPAPPPRTRGKPSAPPRLKSPAPKIRRKSSAPPRQKSPAPARMCRSPLSLNRRAFTQPALSHKLFGQSPQRVSSPAPRTAMTSPPNTRRASLVGSSRLFAVHGLGARPAEVTHTASLPRSGGFLMSRLARLHVHDENDADDSSAPVKRGAIDIVKGLERKRQRRKEKLHQKACAKAAAKADKPYRVKPGKGCERMREVGLELQRYKGKGQHILSI